MIKNRHKKLTKNRENSYIRPSKFWTNGSLRTLDMKSMICTIKMTVWTKMVHNDQKLGSMAISGPNIHFRPKNYIFFFEKFWNLSSNNFWSFQEKSILWQNIHFWSKTTILGQMPLFWQNDQFWEKTTIFGKIKFLKFSENSF